MRYLGGKSRLAPAIFEIISKTAPAANSVTDLFAGSGAFSEFAKRQGFAVTTNDVLYMSYAIARGSIALNQQPSFRKLRKVLKTDPLTYLNTGKLPRQNKSQTIRLSYSPDSNPERMYLTRTNALRIDNARQRLDEWRAAGYVSDDEYFYLLAGVIHGVPFVSNITGTYGAFLKYWDERALNLYQVADVDVFDNGKHNKSYNSDALSLLGSISGQVLYLDPPYNERQYLPNYHVLETIALYDNPVVSGVTGQRPVGNAKSEFCSKRTAIQALNDLISAAQYEHIVLSYNNEGVIPTDGIRETLTSHAARGSVRLIEIPYRRYKNKVPNHTAGLVEQVWYLRKASA
jgi:adenine-specific DNA-methyltransferase